MAYTKGELNWEASDFKSEIEHINCVMRKGWNYAQSPDLLLDAIVSFFSAYGNEIDENKKIKSEDTYCKLNRESYELYDKYFNLVTNALNFGSTTIIGMLNHVIYNCSNNDKDKLELAESLLNMMSKAIEQSTRVREANLKYAKEIGWKIPSEKTADKKSWIFEMPTD